MIKYLDFSKIYTEYHGLDDIISKCLTSGKLILQEGVREFEDRMAEYLEVKHFIALSNGTDALSLALHVSGVGEGDEVITVSNTFVATIEAIHHLGAKPVLVDIGEDGLMDMDKAKKAVTPKTKAIIPVHLEGQMCDMSNLPGVTVIEDSAQAVGAEQNGHKAGTIGRMGCFSFYPAKILGSFGDGGGIATNFDDVADRLKQLRHHSFIGKEPVKNKLYEYGFNRRMDNIWATCLYFKVNFLDRDLAQRKKIAKYYLRALKDLPLTLPTDSKGRVWQDFVIRTPRRQELADYLFTQEIETLGKDMYPNHLYPGLGLDKYRLPMTEMYLEQMLRIPCNPYMDLDDAHQVVKSIKTFYDLY